MAEYMCIAPFSMSCSTTKRFIQIHFFDAGEPAQLRRFRLHSVVILY